jgi:hypothetical protein
MGRSRRRPISNLTSRSTLLLAFLGYLSSPRSPSTLGPWHTSLPPPPFLLRPPQLNRRPGSVTVQPSLCASGRADGLWAPDHAQMGAERDGSSMLRTTTVRSSPCPKCDAAGMREPTLQTPVVLARCGHRRLLLPARHHREPLQEDYTFSIPVACTCRPAPAVCLSSLPA